MGILAAKYLRTPEIIAWVRPLSHWCRTKEKPLFFGSFPFSKIGENSGVRRKSGQFDILNRKMFLLTDNFGSAASNLQDIMTAFQCTADVGRETTREMF